MGYEGLQAETIAFRGHDGDRYAGHGFFSTDQPAYRPEQAVDGWQKVFAFFEKHLAASKTDAAAR